MRPSWLDAPWRGTVVLRDMKPNAGACCEGAQVLLTHLVSRAFHSGRSGTLHSPKAYENASRLAAGPRYVLEVRRGLRVEWGWCCWLGESRLPAFSGCPPVKGGGCKGNQRHFSRRERKMRKMRKKAYRDERPEAVTSSLNRRKGAGSWRQISSKSQKRRWCLVPDLVVVIFPGWWSVNIPSPPVYAIGNGQETEV